MDLQTPPVEFSRSSVDSVKGLVKAAGRTGERTAAREAAEQFEAVFLSQMLAPMMETVDTDPLFGGGPGEGMYKSLMVEEYGKAIARSGGVGIADHVEREILKLQEAQQ